MDWSRYYLNDIPFKLVPFIDVDSPDIRKNGKLFCKEAMAHEMDALIDLLSFPTNVIYVTTDTSVLGLGKSALMAAAYWQLRQEKENVVWTSTTGGYSMGRLLGRIVDRMVTSGYTSMIKETIDITSTSMIKNAIGSSIASPSLTLIRALRKILELPDEEIAKKYANIRRSLLIYDTTDLFKHFLALLKGIGLKDFHFFLDQFEEYVMAHRGASGLRKLGDEVNDAMRTCSDYGTLVVSLHPDAEKLLRSAAGEYITTLGPLEENNVVIHKIQPDEAIKIATTYLNYFRSGKKKDILYPFERSVIQYLAYKADYNVRRFIRFLGKCLYEGAKQRYIPIDEAFMSDATNHARVLRNLTNEWKKFASGKIP